LQNEKRTGSVPLLFFLLLFSVLLNLESKIKNLKSP